jgi:hypothetical protein
MLLSGKCFLPKTEKFFGLSEKRFGLSEKYYPWPPQKHGTHGATVEEVRRCLQVSFMFQGA